jgi:two-component system, sensor histidine kinase and response regulator
MARILVIDDEKQIRAVIADLLALEGHDILQSENGHVGLQTIYQYQPDLVLCDIMMPGIDGYEVLKLLRQSSPPFSTIPLIFLTAKTERIDQRLGMNLGADDYLTKPFDVTDLYKAVNMTLAKRANYMQEINARLQKLQHSGISTSSHEYLTPLTSILGGTEFLYLYGDSMNFEQQREILFSVVQAGKRLERGLQNFLLFQKIQTGVARFEGYERYHLIQNSVSYAIDRVSERFLDRAQDIIVQIDAATPAMDYEYVEKVLIEILDNALKFSLPGSQILIEGERTEQSYIVRVHDRGRGFSEAYIQEIGAFRQFDRAIHEQQGAGLGLYLVRALLQMYGGRMAIDTAEGHGTTVEITFLCA